MAAWNDFLQAIQFGGGLMAGFASTAEKSRQENEQKQLQLLQLLQKDETQRLVPVSAEDIEQPGGVLGALFGGRQAHVRGTGEPATVFSGQGFALRKKPTIGELLGNVASQGTTLTPSQGTTPAPLPQLPPYTPTPGIVPTPAPSVTPTAETPPPLGTPGAVEAITGPFRTPILAAAQSASEATQVPVSQLLGLVAVESSFDPKAQTVSRDPKTGKVYVAQGLGQLIPETQAKHGVTNPFDIAQNLLGTAKEWALSLKKAGGDVRRAYTEFYNPNDSKRFVTADKLEKAIAGFEQSPTVQPQEGRVASTEGGAQPETSPGAGAQPTPESRVAGRATPPASLPADFPEAPTLEQKLAAGEATLLRTYGKLPGSDVNTREFVAHLTTQQQQIRTAHEGELARVRANADRLRKDIHDPRILDMLDRSSSDVQIRHVQKVIDQTPRMQPILDVLDAFAKMTPAQRIASLPAAMLDLQETYNYKPDQIKAVLSETFNDLDINKAVKQAAALHKQKVAGIPEEQAAALPGQERLAAAETGARERTTQARRDTALADATATMQGTITPEKIDTATRQLAAANLTPAALPTLQEAITRRTTLQGEDIKRQQANIGSDVVQEARQLIWKEARESGEIPMDAPIGLLPADLEREVTDRASRIQSLRAVEAKDAESAAAMKRPLLRPHNVLNLQTGERATLQTTREDAIKKNMVEADATTQVRASALRNATKIINLLESLAVGGLDTQGVVNGKPGEILPGIFKAESAAVDRFTGTVGARIASLRQDPTYGKQIVVYEALRNEAAMLIATGVLGDPKRPALQEFLRALEGIPQATPDNTTRFQNARATVEAQYRVLQLIARNQYTYLLGETTPITPEGATTPATPAAPTAKPDDHFFRTQP